MCTRMMHDSFHRRVAVCAFAALTPFVFLLVGCSFNAKKFSRDDDDQRRLAHLLLELKRKNALIEDLREKNQVLKARVKRTRPVCVRSTPVLAVNQSHQASDGENGDVWRFPDGQFVEDLKTQRESNMSSLAHEASNVARAIQIPGDHLAPGVPRTLPLKNSRRQMPVSTSKSASGWMNARSKPRDTSSAAVHREKRPARSQGGVTEAVKGDELLYRKVLQTYRRQNMEEMRKAVTLFLKAYPDSPYADNALHLSALLAMKFGEFKRARGYIDRILENYPMSNKAVSALFMRGRIARRTGEFAVARKVFKRVIRAYPGSPEAQQAPLELRLIAKHQKSEH